MAVEVARPNLLQRAVTFYQRAVTFYHDVAHEMRKVTWPDRPQVKNATIGIIVFVLIVGAVISLMDLVLQGVLVRGLPSLFTGN